MSWCSSLNNSPRSPSCSGRTGSVPRTLKSTLGARLDLGFATPLLEAVENGLLVIMSRSETGLDACPDGLDELALIPVGVLPPRIRFIPFGGFPDVRHT